MKVCPEDPAADLISGVRAAYRADRTIAIGSCAPIPLGDLAALVTRCYPEFAVSSEIQEDAALLAETREDIDSYRKWMEECV